MLTGYKMAEADAAIPRAYVWLGLVMLVAVAAFLVVYLG
jgi:hypothetical protein